MIDYKRITTMSPDELLQREREILGALDQWHGASEVGELKRELHFIRAEIRRTVLVIHTDITGIEP